MKYIIFNIIFLIGILSPAKPEWNVVPAEYEYNASAIIQIVGIQQSDSLMDVITFVKDGKCSGISDQMYFPVTNTYLHITMIYMNTTGIYDILFYSAIQDTVYNIGKMKIKADMIIGTPLKPKQLNIKSPPKEIRKDVPKLFKMFRK